MRSQQTFRRAQRTSARIQYPVRVSRTTEIGRRETLAARPPVLLPPLPPPLLWTVSEPEVEPWSPTLSAASNDGLNCPVWVGVHWKLYGDALICMGCACG